MGHAFSSLDELGEGYGFRKIRKPLGVTAFGVNATVYPPGYEGFFHYHDTQDELYFVHSGEARVVVEGEERILGPGGLFHVDSTTPRKVSNASETDDLVILVVGGKDGYVERDGHMVDEADIERRAAFGKSSLRPDGAEDEVAGEQPCVAAARSGLRRSSARRRRSRREGRAARRARTSAGASGRPRAHGRAGSAAGSVDETHSAPSRRGRPPAAAPARSRRRARPGTAGARGARLRRPRRSSRPRTAADPRRSPAPARSRARRPSRARRHRRRARRPSCPRGSACVSAPERHPRSSTRFPRPIAATNSGMRSGTKTKSPSSRRSRWCSS